MFNIKHAHNSHQALKGKWLVSLRENLEVRFSGSFYKKFVKVRKMRGSLGLLTLG